MLFAAQRACITYRWWRPLTAPRLVRRLHTRWVGCCKQYRASSAQLPQTEQHNEAPAASVQLADKLNSVVDSLQRAALPVMVQVNTR